MAEKTCSKCGAKTSECWTAGRLFVDRCYFCGRDSAPFAPERREIVLVRDLATHVQHAPGQWCFTAFDGYGHVTVDAHNVGASRAQALEKALWELEHTNGRDGYGRCVAVLWAPNEMHGILIEPAAKVTT